jgi:hypothetical protein
VRVIGGMSDTDSIVRHLGNEREPPRGSVGDGGRASYPPTQAKQGKRRGMFPFLVDSLDSDIF